jgi:hypothetical protein
MAMVTCIWILTGRCLLATLFSCFCCSLITHAPKKDDDADYTNVNQCMKFMAKTTMKTATFRDMTLAQQQGTLADAPLSGYQLKVRHNPFAGVVGTWLYLIFSIFFLLWAVLKFRKVRKEKNFAPNWSPKQPLVFA